MRLKSEAKVQIDEERLKQVKIDETRAEEPAPGQTRPAPSKG